VLLSSAVMPTLGGAGWLLNLIQKQVQQLFGLGAGQDSGLDSLPVKGVQVLVEAARIKGVPRI